MIDLALKCFSRTKLFPFHQEKFWNSFPTEFDGKSYSFLDACCYTGPHMFAFSSHLKKVLIHSRVQRLKKFSNWSRLNICCCCIDTVKSRSCCVHLVSRMIQHYVVWLALREPCSETLLRVLVLFSLESTLVLPLDSAKPIAVA